MSATKWVVGSLTLAAAAAAAFDAYERVPNNSFAMKTRMGVNDGELYQAAVYPKIPLADRFYSFSNNTVRFEANVGNKVIHTHGDHSHGSPTWTRNTKDNNSFSMDVRVHYKVKPDAGILTFHLKEMSDNNGRDLLIDQMDDAVNAVVGTLNADEAIAVPDKILKGFVNQLQQRLVMNNIAMEIEMVEMLGMHLGPGFKRNVQLKLIPGHEVQPIISGPSAVPVAPTTIRP